MRDIPDHVLHAHGGPRSSASTSAVDGGTGGYDATASEVSSAPEDNNRMPSRWLTISTLMRLRGALEMPVFSVRTQGRYRESCRGPRALKVTEGSAELC